MNSCTVCINDGKTRKYFFKDKPLCDGDYIDYLEFLIDGMDEEVTNGSANAAFMKLERSLTLSPEPKPKTKPAPKLEQKYSTSHDDDEDEEYSISMRM